jgi:hypothetical protein
MFRINYTKLGYYVVGGVANLCAWGFIVGSLGSLAHQADAFGATFATLVGVWWGGRFYARRHPPQNGRK